jgi:hypothetical protein
MANIKQAVSTGAEFLEDLFPDAADVRLEEVVAQGPVWQIVFSFTTPGESLAKRLGVDSRIYKQVEVERESNEPQALKVWKA